MAGGMKGGGGARGEKERTRESEREREKGTGGKNARVASVHRRRWVLGFWVVEVGEWDVEGEQENSGMQGYLAHQKMPVPI